MSNLYKSYEYFITSQLILTYLCCSCNECTWFFLDHQLASRDGYTVSTLLAVQSQLWHHMNPPPKVGSHSSIEHPVNVVSSQTSSLVRSSGALGEAICDTPRCGTRSSICPHCATKDTFPCPPLLSGLDESRVL